MNLYSLKKIIKTRFYTLNIKKKDNISNDNKIKYNYQVINGTLVMNSGHNLSHIKTNTSV